MNQIPAPKTPGPKTPKINIGFHAFVKEPIQVYCRLRSINHNEVPCIKMVDASSVIMSSPPNQREECLKETQYMFSHVFDENTPQNKIFEHVALPQVGSLLQGKSGLLFTYGITGSGKTFTMTGTPQNPGIMPRALDVIFNSILNFQAKKFVFKPDRLNGFEVQSEEDAKMDGLKELQVQTLNVKTPRGIRRQDSEWAYRKSEETKLSDISDDNMYAVFVTYIEIYNNSVYDLLDENFEENSIRFKGPQSKLVREDGARNMYVHGVTEVEVKTTEEAFEVFNKGQRRKRMAHNSLNAESSRSHSVFTVRLVQAPLDLYGETVMQDKNSISVSQLSFVDLAGSERTCRTNTTGQRLREAGNINNSLMVLRTCLAILRENQMNGTNKLVPYRDSKLTHLFKNFFDGASVVRVIVCVNPRTDDHDENTHVMKFAEMSQEVQITRPLPLANIDNLMSGRRRANQIFRRAMANLNEGVTSIENVPVDVGVPAVYSLASQFPDMCLTGPEDDRLLKNLMVFLEVEIAKRKKFDAELQEKGKHFRALLTEKEKDFLLLSHQNNTLLVDVQHYKEKLANTEVEMNSLRNKSASYERVIKRLQEEIKEKDQALNKRLQDRERDKQKFQTKMALTAEKISQKMEMKLTDQKRQMEMEMRQKDKKLRQVKRILSDEMLAPTTPRSGPAPSSYDLRAASTESLVTPCFSTPSTVTTRKKLYQTPAASGSARAPTVAPISSVAVSNPRHRRSRSVSDDRWLEHRPTAPVPLNTVMQPVLKKRKSITKLTDIQDVANSKTSKYCLLTQQQDSDGDLETLIYKGDVVPTCGGGAQVILNDVEILKQKSPGSSPTRKRSGNTPACSNTEEKCSISIEGHSKRQKK